MTHPEWATKFKEKLTELRCIGGRYYLYRISSKWDKERKVTRKTTHELIGRITQEDGLIPRGTKRVKPQSKADLNDKKIVGAISVKEFGATNYLASLGEDILAELKIQFPDIWQEIFALSLNRLLYRSPLKNMSLHYQSSFMSEKFPDLDLSKNTLTSLISKIGESRDCAAKFMSKFTSESRHLIFDLTDIVSQSKKVQMSAKGYNSHYNFDPQVNLFYMFASDQQLPVFYRIFPGNISGMKALNLSIKESGATKALAIGDKGFCSEENIQMLEETVLDYILPLRRDSSYLNYSRLEQALYDKAFDGHFMHYGRPVFYYTMPNYKAIITNKKPENPNKFEAYIYQENGVQENGAQGNGVQGNGAQGNGEYVIWIKEQLITITQRQLLASLKQTPASLGADSEITDKELLDGLRRFVIKNKIKGVNFDSSKKTVIFVDRALRLEEERTYLSRIDDKVEGYDLEGYQDKQLSFGTIGLITNCISHDPKSVYLNFKTRMEVETVFDTYKNLLEADRSYMQSDNSMNGWMFINHVSVMLYYKLLNLIKSKNMEGQISPQDVLVILQKINKVKINNEWHISEISSKNIKTLTKLGLPVTY